jgi:hypothetical protein
MASYPQKSRTTNLLELFEKVTSSTDGDGAAVVVFMDFAKPWIRYQGGAGKAAISWSNGAATEKVGSINNSRVVLSGIRISPEQFLNFYS